MSDGVINIYKEKGYTSHDVVAKLRGILRQRKIGHTGTLDPDAQGVLPVCLGKATKLCDMLIDKSKAYRAVLLLGVETDTQDTSGKTLSELPVTVEEEEVRKAILSFVGEYMQIPPMYSALKVNGKKLYQLAREGKEVVREPRPVEIYEITIDEISLPRVTMTVRCSKGTYIRTLCHDIGLMLGCGGCMEDLLRVQVGQFLIKDSLTLEQVEKLRDEGTIEEVICPIDQMFLGYQEIVAKETLDRYLHNGNPFRREDTGISEETKDQTFFRVYDSQKQFIGVYRYQKEQDLIKPQKLFLGGN